MGFCRQPVCPVQRVSHRAGQGFCIYPRAHATEATRIYRTQPNPRVALKKREKEEIRAFLKSNSAEKHLSEVSLRILLSIKDGKAPIRTTERLFWKNTHSKLDKSIFLRDNIRSVANCKACHMDVDGGLFEDMKIFIPPLGGGGVESAAQ